MNSFFSFFLESGPSMKRRYETVHDRRLIFDGMVKYRAARRSFLKVTALVFYHV